LLHITNVRREQKIPLHPKRLSGDGLFDLEGIDARFGQSIDLAREGQVECPRFLYQVL
jgi:hypothetical protein